MVHEVIVYYPRGYGEAIGDSIQTLRRIVTPESVFYRMPRAEKLRSEGSLHLLAIAVGPRGRKQCFSAHGKLQAVTQEASGIEPSPGLAAGTKSQFPAALVPEDPGESIGQFLAADGTRGRSQEFSKLAVFHPIAIQVCRPADLLGQVRADLPRGGSEGMRTRIASLEAFRVDPFHWEVTVPGDPILNSNIETLLLSKRPYLRGGNQVVHSIRSQGNLFCRGSTQLADLPLSGDQIIRVKIVRVRTEQCFELPEPRKLAIFSFTREVFPKNGQVGALSLRRIQKLSDKAVDLGNEVWARNLHDLVCQVPEDHGMFVIRGRLGFQIGKDPVRMNRDPGPEPSFSYGEHGVGKITFVMA